MFTDLDEEKIAEPDTGLNRYLTAAKERTFTRSDMYGDDIAMSMSFPLDSMKSDAPFTSTGDYPQVIGHFIEEQCWNQWKQLCSAQLKQAAGGSDTVDQFLLQSSWLPTLQQETEKLCWSQCFPIAQKAIETVVESCHNQFLEQGAKRVGSEFLTELMGAALRQTAAAARDSCLSKAKQEPVSTEQIVTSLGSDSNKTELVAWVDEVVSEAAGGVPTLKLVASAEADQWNRLITFAAYQYKFLKLYQEQLQTLCISYLFDRFKEHLYYVMAGYM